MPPMMMGAPMGFPPPPWIAFPRPPPNFKAPGGFAPPPTIPRSSASSVKSSAEDDETRSNHESEVGSEAGGPSDSNKLSSMNSPDLDRTSSSSRLSALGDASKFRRPSNDAFNSDGNSAHGGDSPTGTRPGSPGSNAGSSSDRNSVGSSASVFGPGGPPPPPMMLMGPPGAPPMMMGPPPNGMMMGPPPPMGFGTLGPPPPGFGGMHNGPPPPGVMGPGPYGFPTQGRPPYPPGGPMRPGGPPPQHTPTPPPSNPASADSDTASVRSVSTSNVTPSLQAAMHSYGESLEMYRQNAKRSNDQQVQLDFAKFLITAAEGAMESDPDQRKAKRNQDMLYAESLKWVKKLATSGSGRASYPEAMFFLAECYGNGSLGLTVDHDRAFNLYVQASKQSHPASTYRAAVCYEVGAGTRRDPARAVQFYRKAAALGDTAAMYKLGMILLNGLLSQQKNPREGVTWLKRAASQADETTPHALHELAVLYEGKGADTAGSIIPDPAYSHDLFLRAAQLGYAPSQYRLGLCHEYGLLDLPIDPRRSIAWYTRAAEQGDPEAELALSGWYLTGAEGVLKQSDTEAYLWARKAADKGLAKAEYAVGYYSEHGVGVRADIEEARKWYLRAAAQGNKRAVQRLKELKGYASGGGDRSRKGDWRKDTDAKNGDCSVM
ncbi:hypothetical protein HDU67_007719 [Dinochytrium kinnereticum]|nr:hypothetical protein HDU67_007719 [Dinochytrium kinnereticum]